MTVLCAILIYFVVVVPVAALLGKALKNLRNDASDSARLAVQAPTLRNLPGAPSLGAGEGQFSDDVRPATIERI